MPSGNNPSAPLPVDSLVNTAITNGVFGFIAAVCRPGAMTLTDEIPGYSDGRVHG
jgi:hypothetical protein